MKKFAAICDTSRIFNYPPIISILAALGLNENNFKTIPIKGSLQLFCSSCSSYMGKDDIISLLEKDNIKFDSIYLGNLSTIDDINTVISFLDKFTTESTKIVVNPVMEDKSEEFVSALKTLIKRSSVITPSYTEASFLLEKEEGEKVATFEELKDWVTSLSSMGPRDVLITDIPDKNHEKDTIVFSYDKETSAYWVIPSCYNKEAKFNFIDVLTELIIKDSQLSQVMDNFI